jgi:hypothetical protein
MINTSPQEIDQKTSRKRKWETIITIVKGLNPRIKERTVDHGVSLIYLFFFSWFQIKNITANFFRIMKLKGKKGSWNKETYLYCVQGQLNLAQIMHRISYFKKPICIACIPKLIFCEEYLDIFSVLYIARSPK